MDFGVSYFQTKTMFVQVPCETSLHLLTSTVAGTCWCPCQRFVRPWADGSVLKRKFNANFDRCVDHDRKRAEVRLKHLVHAPFCLQLIPDEEYICLSGMFFHYRQLALGCGIVSKCMEHAKNWWWMFFSEWQWQWGIFNPIGCKNCRPSVVDSWTWMMGTIGRNACILEKTNRMVSVQIISHRSMDSRIRVAYIYHSSWLSHIQSTWLIVH